MIFYGVDCCRGRSVVDMFLMDFVFIVLLFCCVTCNAKTSIEDETQICSLLQGKAKATNPQGQADTNDIDQTVSNGNPQKIPNPKFWNKILVQKLAKRSGTEYLEGDFGHQGLNLQDTDSNIDYDEGFLKKIFLHLFKYPRYGRAGAKADNFHLRASFIPRLGKRQNSESGNSQK